MLPWNTWPWLQRGGRSVCQGSRVTSQNGLLLLISDHRLEKVILIGTQYWMSSQLWRFQSTNNTFSQGCAFFLSCMRRKPTCHLSFVVFSNRKLERRSPSPATKRPKNPANTQLSIHATERRCEADIRRDSQVVAKKQRKYSVQSIGARKRKREETEETESDKRSSSSSAASRKRRRSTARKPAQKRKKVTRKPRRRSQSYRRVRKLRKEDFYETSESSESFDSWSDKDVFSDDEVSAVSFDSDDSDVIVFELLGEYDHATKSGSKAINFEEDLCKKHETVGADFRKLKQLSQSWVQSVISNIVGNPSLQLQRLHTKWKDPETQLLATNCLPSRTQVHGLLCWAWPFPWASSTSKPTSARLPAGKSRAAFQWVSPEIPWSITGKMMNDAGFDIYPPADNNLLHVTKIDQLKLHAQLLLTILPQHRPWTINTYNN